MGSIAKARLGASVIASPVYTTMALNAASILEMDAAFSAIVVYTGDAITEAPRRALAIEPMTGASDAFNHPEWGLRALTPEESFTGRYTIRFRDDAAR